MLEKTSDKIIALVAVFIVAGIAFYLLYAQQQSVPVEEEPELDIGFGVPEDLPPGANTAPIAGTCGQQALQLDKDLCWLWQAVDEQKVELCDNIPDLSTRVDCITGIARDTVNEQLCQKLSGNEALLYYCITQVAKETADYSYCEGMPEFYKKKCVTQVDQELGVAAS